MTDHVIPEYGWKDSDATCAHAYLLSGIEKALADWQSSVNLKNLVMALSGKLDNHFTVLWDGGHIKFWSRQTLTSILRESGFKIGGFYGVGRFPWIWKSMIMTANKPRI